MIEYAVLVGCALAFAVVNTWVGRQAGPGEGWLRLLTGVGTLLGLGAAWWGVIKLGAGTL